jgi:AraC-like DNA-binding protein
MNIEPAELRDDSSAGPASVPRSGTDRPTGRVPTRLGASGDSREGVAPNPDFTIGTGSGASAEGPTSWRLERNLRQVTFAQCPELSVFSETTSARMAAVHAHPAWTLLSPVDGGTVTVVANDVVRVRNDGVLLAPQIQYRAATDGPHVAVYANAWRSARPQSMRPRMVGSNTGRRVLGVLDVDHGTDLSESMVELATLVGRIGALDSRLAFVIEALPDAGRLDGLAADVGISASRLRALANENIGVPLTQLRLWSRLARAIAWLPYGTTATAATAAGFADQAHFTRTARRFLGRTPGGLSLRPLVHQPHHG